MASQTENIQEKRLTIRLRNYWDRIKETDDVPNVLKFSSGTISDVWENCLLIKVVSNNKNRLYNIEVTGRELQTALGKDLRGKYFSLAGGEIFSRDFVKILDASIERRAFLLSEGSFVNKKGKIIKYRDCILPFKNFKDDITTLVVGISWRAF